MSKFWNTSVLGGHWIYDAFKFCLKYQGTNYFIVFLFIFMKKPKFGVLLEYLQEFHEKPMSCFYQITNSFIFWIFGSKFLDK